MKKFLIVALAAILAFSSCMKNDVLIYNMSITGRVTNGRIVSDENIIYNVVESLTDDKLGDYDRVIVLCDVLEEVVSGKEFNVKLKDYAPMVTIIPVAKTSQNDEWFGSDAINMVQGWFSAGYLNMLVYITMVENSKTEHRISLMFNDTADNTDTLHFYLKHNGYGETYDVDPDNSKMKMSNGYVSFPLDAYVPDGAKGMPVSIEWDWFDNNGSDYIHDKKIHYKEKGYYTKMN